MAVNIIDGFRIDTSLPIDDRIIASNSNTRNNITYKYDGLEVLQLDNRVEYVWNESTYVTTGVTSSSWDIITSVKGQGIYNRVPKWISSGVGLTNTSIISVTNYYGEVGQKVGIGTLPFESFQISSNYLTFSNYYTSGTGTCSPPFVVHKGSNTIIGENWYYDIPSSTDRTFDHNFSSGAMSFKNGLEFRGRTASNSATMSSLFNVYNNGYNKLSGISYIPNVINGAIYYSLITGKVNVGESSKWRNISNFDIYTILLSQSGSSSPTQTLLETTVGTGTWSYQSTGTYNLAIDNGFTSAVSISGFCGPHTSTSVFSGQKINNNLYQIRTLSLEGGSLSNSKLNNTFIEIKFIDSIN